MVSEGAFRVLLIGGSSGTGKTTIAQQLAEFYGYSVVLVDDLRLAAQAIISAEQHPDLHVFLRQGTTAYDSAEAYRDGLITVAQVMLPAIRMVVDHHIAVDAPIIIEGDGILPQLITSGDKSRVQAVFLHEPDETIILNNMLRRRRGFEKAERAQQRIQAHGSGLYGEWLKSKAEKQGVSVIDARPFETLLERVKTAVI